MSAAQEELALLDRADAARWDATPGPPSLTAEVLVGGVPVEPPEPEAPCAHDSSVFLSQPVVAFIQNEDGTAVAAMELKVSARCGGCGAELGIDPAGRAPRDGGPGVVLTLRAPQ